MPLAEKTKKRHTVKYDMIRGDIIEIPKMPKVVNDTDNVFFANEEARKTEEKVSN